MQSDPCDMNIKQYQSPDFLHPELTSLYHHGFDIPRATLEEILALPSASLTDDLEKILLDAVERYNYYSGFPETKDSHAFVLHALYILKELNAYDSLPAILTFFEMDEEIIDFYTVDHMTEYLWQCIYTLGCNQPEKLKDFLLLPGLYTYARAAVAHALGYISRRHLDRKKEIEAIFSELFTTYAVSLPDDGLIDVDYIGLAICDASESQMDSLLPEKNLLFEKGYVSVGICVHYEEVKKMIHHPDSYNFDTPVSDIFTLYKQMSGFMVRPRPSGYVAPIVKPKPAASNKIGRNDPCPCGSGKKYKKCCLNVL